LAFRFSQDLNASTIVDKKWDPNYWAIQIPNKYMDEANEKRKGELHENRRKSNEEKAISQEDMTQELHQQIKSEHA